MSLNELARLHLKKFFLYLTHAFMLSSLEVVGLASVLNILKILNNLCKS